MPRNVQLRLINALTVVGALFLLLSSVWPGMLRGCTAILLLPLILLLGLWWLALVIGAASSGTPDWDNRLAKRALLLAPLLVLMTYGMLKFYIPRRIAFLAVRDNFAALVPSVPVGAYRGQEVDLRIGIYRIDRYATDPRGGVYFRTGHQYDMIDTISYGFAYEPNPTGSPFGRAGYRLYRLGGGWYWFRASDDYY